MSRTTLVILAVVGAAGAAIIAGTTRNSVRPETVDFGATRTALTPAHDARVAPATAANVRTFRIPISHDTVEIADGVRYEGWTLGGTVPGPVIRVRQGDQVKIVLVNQAPMGHSIDFHAARTPMNRSFRMVMPGDSLAFEFEARDPGVFMVHCGTPPVLLHIMQGMYLPIIVDPRDGWPDHADKEFVIVQSEFYAGEAHNGVAPLNFEAAVQTRPSYVVFNGKADQYKANPLQVDEGDHVRFFVLNAGPSLNSDFHIVGAIFDRVFVDGNLDRPLRGVQTVGIPAGGGAVFETSFERGLSGEGVYAFVTHSFADASKGAVGLITVGHPQIAQMPSH
ncbi:MAG TPA: multicopper oxidase domain-containing protein [Gemmatimonadales bacterium]|jgi:nitrite reductase (NO-forming)